MKNTKKLADDLNNYLNNKKNDPNFWTRDSIGLIIRKFCEVRGNFKKAPSGNPKKGYKKMIEKSNNIEEY